MLKILIVGVLAIGLMAAIRDGRVLRDTGLLSSCSQVGGPESTVESCTKGRLDGYPDLTNKSCTLVSVRRQRQFWRCEAPIVSSQSPTG